MSPGWSGVEFTSVFLGGGTPTAMEPAELGDLLDHLRASFDVRPDAEVTIEANPDTVDEERFPVLLAAGFGRLSMGAQSFDLAVLAALERVHSPGLRAVGVRGGQGGGLREHESRSDLRSARRDAGVLGADAPETTRSARTRQCVRPHDRARDPARTEGRGGRGAGARPGPPG